MASYIQPHQKLRLSDQQQQLHLRSFEVQSPMRQTVTLASDIAETQPTQTFTADYSNSNSNFNQHKRSQSYASISGTTGENSKRLLTLLGAQHNTPTTSSTNAISFHSPSHGTPNKKSIRQKIGNAKPVTPSHSLIKDRTGSLKHNDGPKIGAGRILRNPLGRHQHNQDFNSNNLLRFPFNKQNLN